jgi:hypothetical protein
MSIGDVFAKAWELWRRDVGWLILAGLVVGAIMAVVFGIVFAIFAGILAGGAGLSIGSGLTTNDSGTLGALGAGMLVAALLVYVVTVFIVDVIAMVFYGGMFEMVIGAARDDRAVAFGDLFSGFKRFGAYALFALVIFGISLATSLLNIIPVIGFFISTVVMIWIWVIWLYVLPLIADQGAGFGDAAKRSNQMVKDVGWWRTFGMVILLGLAVGAALLLIVVIAAGIGRGSGAAGAFVGVLLFLGFAVLVPTYSICYVSVMYLGSGGAQPAVAGAAPMAGVPIPPPPGGPTYSLPPAPPYPPAVSGPATPAIAAPPPPPPSAPAPPPPGPADASAWKAAADPLAAQPPSPPAAEPHVHQERGAPATPSVDGASGRLEKHCSQCGALIGGSEEFCQACALEVSGGETDAAAPPPVGGAPEPAATETPPAAPEAPQAPEAPLP